MPCLLRIGLCFGLPQCVRKALTEKFYCLDEASRQIGVCVKRSNMPIAKWNLPSELEKVRESKNKSENARESRRRSEKVRESSRKLGKVRESQRTQEKAGEGQRKLEKVREN